MNLKKNLILKKLHSKGNDIKIFQNLILFEDTKIFKDTNKSYLQDQSFDGGIISSEHQIKLTKSFQDNKLIEDAKELVKNAKWNNINNMLSRRIKLKSKNTNS